MSNIARTGSTETDYDKIRRLPFLYLFSTFTGTAFLLAVGAPFTLYLTELGFESKQIGILGGIMPFFQAFGIVFLPVILKFGSKKISILAYSGRYVFILLFLLVPVFNSNPDAAFWILLLAIALFSLSRTIAEAAFVPWTQEIIPRSIRGSVFGKLSLYVLPAALFASYFAKLWLDSRTGLDRFYPIFLIAIFLGLAGAMSLLKLTGGRPIAVQTRGVASFRGLLRPLRDRNFLLLLFSTGTQYLVFVIINVFLILFFKDKFGVPAGQLVLMTAISLIGGAIGSYSGGWLVDRHGSRGVRIVAQVAQVALLFVVILPVGAFAATPVLSAIFLGFGILFGASITAGNVYLLNYVPSDAKESYMGLAYSMDGVIGGVATFGAGYLIFWFQNNHLQILGVNAAGYEILFALCALAIVASTISYAFLQEEGATGFKEFVRQFYVSNPIGVLWGIHRYSQRLSEERRLDLAHQFGGSGSLLAREELLNALDDPSFDVRYEAIVALGHLPKSPVIVRALEARLDTGNMLELQFAAITSLGRIGAKSSSKKIAVYLNSEQPLLRARAIRAIGDIKDHTYLADIRNLLENESDINCWLAAVSTVGKFQDRRSFNSLVRHYCRFDIPEKTVIDDANCKVILLALSKILSCEGLFIQELQRENKNPGLRLHVMINRIVGSSASKFPNIADDLAKGDARSAFQALQQLGPKIVGNSHRDALEAEQVLEITKEIVEPHSALLVFLSVVLRRILKG
ncbi:MAG: MFS transporter [Rhizobiales bacterium]|nr:MFS transporter [Hyphomicrobiales bacterium]NRB14318.1 MFS transporter [Hyphomicrobiales bacterium]